MKEYCIYQQIGDGCPFILQNYSTFNQAKVRAKRRKKNREITKKEKYNKKRGLNLFFFISK